MVDEGKASDVVYLGFGKVCGTASPDSLLEKLAAQGLGMYALGDEHHGQIHR